MPTLKASEPGLAKIQQVKNESGRTVDDERWLLEASLILQPQGNWQSGGPYAPGCSETSWKRFLRRTPIATDTFKAFCQVLGLDWQKIVDRHPDFVEPPLKPVNRRQDWDSAPDCSIFYGRATELAKLQQWIVKDRCRLVALLGMPGIGKTALAVKLARQIQEDFELVIWRSLFAAPTLEQLLADLLPSELSNRTTANISQFLEYLRSRRCLIVLDGVEAILESGQLAGSYRDGYQDYGQLFRKIGESQHQSTVVLTSSERPTEIALLEDATRLVCSLTLTDLDKQAARELLITKGLSDDPKLDYLVQLYRGNPLALTIVSRTILDLYNGKVANFIKENTIFMGKIDKVLEQPLARLSDLEREVIQQLAIARSPLSISQMREQMASLVSTSQLMEAVESLRERSLLEKITGDSETLFTLQPVIRKYIINRLNAQKLGGN